LTLQHIVLFSFPEELSAADAADMRAQVAAWPEKIGGFGAIRFGRDLTDKRTRGYQYLLYSEFDDDIALQTYQEHPVHQYFLSWVLDRSCTPLAFDYHLTPDTIIWPPAGSPEGQGHDH
jgi:stress responsive alpha/beta barrel protein